MKTYISQDVEVKLTGRKATRTIPGKTTKQEVVEVTPLDEDNGTWKKWVPMNSLFEIEDTKSR